MFPHFYFYETQVTYKNIFFPFEETYTIHIHKKQKSYFPKYLKYNY